IVQLEKAAELSKDTTEYRRRLDDLRLKRRVAARFGVHTLERLPGVTPIGMDIAEDLARLVSDATVSGLSATAEALTSAMRERVQGELGVRLPGVRYRKNTDLPAGIYVLMLNEVPYGSGATPVDKRFTSASRARLTGLNVPVEEAERPDGGGTGFWITEPYWPNVAAQDELWEILEWPVRHLEQLVRRNLPLYFGHQEATYLLRENGGPAAKDILEDGQKLTALVITLCALVSEEVPIVALTPILDRFLELYAKDMKPHDIVEQLRLLPDLRAHLPGVGARIALHRLGDRFEERIQRAMSSDNGRFVLALLPDDCQALLTAVREQARNRPSALIVSNPALRPFVRKLVQLEFPELSVLAAEELQAGVLQQGLPMVEIPQ
ncbi:MAG TPA: FHIPEP family type III secretion protein, partial [Gemmatimonadaceae bacterium]|nr:FHIPEP family type III secretion protein [Gemmatimonadaceae bacterium]